MAVPLVIDELWAWVSTDVEGEGVLAAPIPRLGNLLTVPMVGADMERMRSLEPIARQMANAFGVGVSLVRFSYRELIMSITPDTP